MEGVCVGGGEDVTDFVYKLRIIWLINIMNMNEFDQRQKIILLKEKRKKLEKNLNIHG
jgi:hypothetical protein